jgi:hypothetical protein
MRFVVLGVAAAMAIAAPAAAVTFTVNVGASRAVPTNNNYIRQFAALGLTSITTTGASISLSAPALLRFEYFGSESGFVNTFSIAGSTPPLSFTETNKVPFGPTPMFSASAAAGLVNNWLFSSTSSLGEQNKGIGTANFAIYIPRAAEAAGSFVSNVLYLGFDDQINNRDDDFEDFVVRVEVVPEPQSWAMLIAGFGLVGAIRRRRTQAVSA